MKNEVDNNVYELQTTWFELAMAQSFVRQKNYASALRHYKFILKQYEDI